ncbi:cue domain containing protein [Grosmannia clavigera kw1407]|uniref:Cue domain containing protein n=1 Tax=Grosmannia clavigera (strain kw1407 / UAMH 11150) TaxID=655863 RepID=F0XUU3_GROCL|nr:cue domain containing protein [Grosmannia clavigera kw1407]EFW99022.1 cue domain containing protein [Grosmannia clavigera kw1407]
MDAFVTRKKRPADEPSTRLCNRPGIDDDDAPTEVKLALLASLLDGDMDQDVLLDVLLAHDGSVAAAAETLQRGPAAAAARRKRPRASSGAIQQTSLRGFATQSTQTKQVLQVQPLLSRRGRTLDLFDPVDVEAHTPCTLLHNFLPADTANALLHEMLAEAPSFATPRFQLFEQVVTSPHTMGFFVDDGLDVTSVPTSTTPYLYNGSRIDNVRPSTPQLAAVRPIVQAAVNTAVRQRIAARYPGGCKLRHQHPGPWCPNAAFVNCYSGPQQSVGWHSDQLTYLGPRAVIGSLSLGVTREFRISIHLPHNSLLVMHAEMQEQWKHCIAPTTSIDLHPIAGNKRINITYRHYRPEFHPNNTPQCRCRISAVLRVVMKKKDNYGRYFWMCHAGNIPDNPGCSFFQWAEFDDDGYPIWRHKPRVALEQTDSNKVN